MAYLYVAIAVSRIMSFVHGLFPNTVMMCLGTSSWKRVIIKLAPLVCLLMSILL
jgi:hypothetical protein